MINSYKDRLSKLELSKSMIQECNQRLCLLTGQSSFVTSRLDKGKLTFLNNFSSSGLLVTPIGFPWHHDLDNNYNAPSLISASLRNSLQMLWLRYDITYKKIVKKIIHHALASTNERLVIVTGSCGIEYLSVALNNYSDFKTKIEVIALGPVGRNIDDTHIDCFQVIQGTRDSWSKMLWRGTVHHKPKCNHLEYYNCPETFKIIHSLIKRD